MRRMWVFLFVLFLLASRVPLVAAQEATVVPEATTAKGGDQPAPVDQSAEAKSALNSTITEYFSLVEQYRDAESKYKIAREQYYSLNTLQAQEDAISRGRDLLEIRSKVLLQYLRYLTLLLESTNGIPQEDKESSLLALSNESLALVQNMEGSKDLARRGEIDAQFAALNTREAAIMNVVYGSLSLVKLGELQNAIDTSSVLANDVETWMKAANLTSADRLKRERGLEEVRRLLKESAASLTGLVAQRRAQVAQGGFSRNSYDQFQSKQESGYALLRQAFAFLQEVAKNGAL